MVAASASPAEELAEYRKKRDFTRSPEPAGAAGSAGGIFVVQKHAASRLHYDFRLELDGVLKSWAVPKGPSVDPKVRRLAMHVEDHPLEYAGFEGIIPKGQYGGGTVMIWDSGYWIPIGDPHAGYLKGNLKFNLIGSKLHGKWVLVREKQSRQEGKEGWFLIKERDEFSGEADITALNLSAATGRSMADIAAQKEGIWTSERGAENPELLVTTTIAGAKSAPMPEFIPPQLATLVKKVPAGDEWVHEIKHDGYRLLCRIDKGKVRIFTRRGNDWTEKFPGIRRQLEELPVRQAWLDGEAVVLLPSGISSFQALQNALSRISEAEILYYVFDLLYLNGMDLRVVPLVRRKELLRPLAESSGGVIRYSDHITGAGDLFFQNACGHTVEGIVSKLADSPYISARAKNWLKIKCHNSQEFVIGGFTDPGGARTGFGALLLGAHDKQGNLLYMGRVGTGFNEKLLQSLYEKLVSLEADRSPFDHPLSGRDAKGVHWVRPELVAEIDFAEITDEGVLRHPSFQGLREDRVAADVVLEVPQEPPAASSVSSSLSVPANNAYDLVRRTNPEKLLFPEEKITKQDLAAYYANVFPMIMPHLRGRPLTLVRCPEGWNGECFFQKHAYENVPPAIRRIRLEEEVGVNVDYMAVENLEGLLGLVQMGILEIHTWGSRYETLEFPDKVVFDLDPDEGLPWERLAEGALLVRNRLLDLGLESFLKTTGGKGFHVVVPVVPERSWEEVKEFSRKIAEGLSRAYPDRFTPKMAKDLRANKIFIDWMRNVRGATAIEVFSTRRKAGAPVSVPLHWEEAAGGTRPDAFSVRNFGSRLATLKKDPWHDYFLVRQTLPFI